MHLTNLILTSLLASATSVSARKKDDAVLLSKVKSLTLRDGAYTSHRRVEAIPQLTCVGGSGKGLYTVDVMRCHNSGAEYDAEDIQWTCKADLPPEFKLGSTDVICEGYDSSDDSFVLKGSCGVEYRLVLTPQGEQKYRNHIDYNSWVQPTNHRNKQSKGDGVASFLFWVLFAVIVCVILYSIFFPSGAPQQGFGRGVRRGTNWGQGFGGGGGGDDGNDDPPPPYTPRAPKPKTQRHGSNSRQGEQWRPGFWTGTAAGAAAGYAAGAYNNRQNRNQARPGTSNWFGGTNTSPTGGFAGPSYTGGSSSYNNAPAPSSSRHESTGFGGTRRR